MPLSLCNSLLRKREKQPQRFFLHGLLLENLMKQTRFKVPFACLFTTLPTMFSLSVSSLTQADPLDTKMIPADARWVVHVDMDAARDTKLWAAVDDQLTGNRDFQNGIGKVEQITGASFPRDLNDVTLYGRSSDDAAGVVIVHAHVNRQQIETLLKMNLAYESKPYGDYQLLTWHDDDKNKTMFGTFRDDSTMIIARSADLVRFALDVMDGKSPSIKVDSPLAAGAKPQLLAFVAASSLKDLKKPGEDQSPVIQQMQSAWISLTETNGNADLKASVVADTAQNAEQLTHLLDGVKAFVAIQANTKAGNDSPAQIKAKTLSSLLEKLTCKRDDKTITLDWTIAVDKSIEAFDTLIDRKPAPGNNP
jgi:hypothetical protein